MSEVKDVRAALEKLKKRQKDADGHIVDFRSGLAAEWFGHGMSVASALVSEGLAACDRYESVLRPAIIDSWSKMAIQTNGDQVTLLASILRKAGLLK